MKKGNWVEEVGNSTYGFELEFADTNNADLVLPTGYGWTTNDLTRMHNSDGSAVTKTGKHGGEINTRPYKYEQDDLDELKWFIDHLRENGGYLMWNEGFDAHFYIKHLPLDVIKRLFELSYYTATHVKKIFKFANWFENKYLAPNPDYSYVRKVNAVESIEEIPAIFANGSQKGHIRFMINLVPITKIGTVEFRLFNSSWNFEEMDECIRFMYSYIDYAYKNTDVSKYKELNSVEACEKAFNVDSNKTPNFTDPLIWAEEHTNNMTIVGEGVRKNRVVMGKIVDATKSFDTVHVVNSFFMDIEQVLCQEKSVVLYTKELFTFIAYKIILEEDFRFELKEPFEFIEIDEGTKAERLAKLYLFEQVKKCLAGNAHQSRRLNDFKTNIKSILERMVPDCQKVIDRIAGKKIQVIKGDLEDALNNTYGDDKAIVVYQSEFNQSEKSASNSLASYSGIEWQRWATFYSKLDISTVNYVVVSKNKFLGLEKVLRDGRTFVYSNVEMKTSNRYSARPNKPVMYKKIPDDHIITKKSTIKYIRASMSEIDYLRSIYLKKDILLGSAIFNYLWFVDDFLIGATMFDYSKQAQSGGDKVWMKSDFVVDSPIPKLSKLLIMAVKSKEFKEELDFKYRTCVDYITTTVFSNNSVSMKYRGVFELDKRESGKLYYDAKAGSIPSMKAVITEYLQKSK